MDKEKNTYKIKKQKSWLIWRGWIWSWWAVVAVLCLYLCVSVLSLRHTHTGCVKLWYHQLVPNHIWLIYTSVRSNLDCLLSSPSLSSGSVQNLQNLQNQTGDVCLTGLFGCLVDVEAAFASSLQQNLSACETVSSLPVFPCGISNMANASSRVHNTVSDWTSCDSEVYSEPDTTR